MTRISLYGEDTAIRFDYDGKYLIREQFKEKGKNLRYPFFLAYRFSKMLKGKWFDYFLVDDENVKVVEI